MFRIFAQDRRANVAMITALTLIPILGLLGGALDVVRATTAASQLRSAIDSAALAAANLNNTADTETVVTDYIRANFGRSELDPDDIDVSVTANTALNSKTVTITATGEINTFFLSLFAIQSLPVRAEATANQSKTNVEIALVLDISSSMKGGRIANLKTAAESFIDQMLDEDSEDVTSISLIPFGGTVNLGPTLFNAYAVPVASAVLDPTEAQYDQGSAVPGMAFRFSDGDYCLEYPAEDFDSGVIPAQSRGQVPHFWRWNNFNPWCPLASSAVVMNTNDASALRTHIQGMTLSDGTGMDIGAMWGLKALSPNWQGLLGGDFSDRPAAYDEDTLKVLVVMTDGGITSQDRPEDYTRFNTHTNRSNEPADGDGYSNQGNNHNKQVVVSQGGKNTPATNDSAVGYFKRVCDDAKAEGAVIYTIGFQISSDSLPDVMLEYCASDASKYYHVESLDIQSAFDAIAASVNALRIVG